MNRVRRPCLAMLAALVLLADVAPQATRGDEPSPEYQASLRRTLELRRQRQRRQGRGVRPAPVGVIVPYPLPPSLIIRQTAEVHGEIEGLLRMLRR